MFKGLLGLFGAGGIAGLLSYAPWIIAAIVALVGAGGFVWTKHDLDAANAALVTKQQELNTANVALGAAQAANLANLDVIAQMTANDAANDALIDELQHTVDEDARASTDAGLQIRNLSNDNPDVASFLGTPIPCSLRAALNGPSKPVAGTDCADKDGGADAAKAKPVPVTAK